ncbi:MAG: SRPBCC family protein [Planctomycetes bacterium]|nr:SRPBCC family protein [Planctomycetota bacterium]MCB9826409.1 SRPBCC family protein [Planctomycetota bacterium]MCB9828157.1 SRPBCC family protein [Planctomycetota bacterium]MCB9901495.1 SRPBCC family protein [Planctomycetota bacterium]
MSAEGSHTIRLHRVFRAPPERVYKAFLDPDALVKWMAPHGFTARVLSMDAREGGSYRMTFTNFGTGGQHSFGGTYLELVPGKRLRYNDRFDDPAMPGEMEVTVDLVEAPPGTEVTIVQAGIPAMIPPTLCVAGWQESLALLAHVVEPEIPDGA